MSKKRQRDEARGKVQIEDVPLFDATSAIGFQEALAYLSEHGMVVFRDVMPESERVSAIDKFWDYIEACTEGRVCRDRPETWTNANWPQSLGNGILSTHGIGSSDFLWYVRTRPAIRKLFEAFFETSELMASLDGCSVFRGSEHAFTPSRSWLHTDVNFNVLPPRTASSNASVGESALVSQSVQGMVTLLPVDGLETGSFCWIDGSHRAYADEWKASRLANNSSPDKHVAPAGSWSHYCQLVEGHPLLAKSTSVLRIPAGCFVLWDSALVHANMPPRSAKTAVYESIRLKQQQGTLASFLNPRSAPVDSAKNWQGVLRRLVAYVTMFPTRSVPDSGKLARLRQNHIVSAKAGFSTSHWPCQIWKDNYQSKYPRSAHHGAIVLPRACVNRAFSEAEHALLVGSTFV